MEGLLVVKPVSPCCLARLETTPRSATCSHCGRAFPKKEGFLDLRLPKRRRLLHLVNNLPLVARIYPFWRRHSTRLLTGGGLTHRAELAHLEAAFSGLSGPFLDVGTGSGAYLGPLVGLGPTFGVDASLAFLKAARRHHPEATLLLARAEALPFPKESFLGVAFGPTLNELEDPRRALLETARVLKPEGRLFFALALGRGRRFGLWLPTEEEVVSTFQEAGFLILWSRKQKRFLLGVAEKPPK